MTSLTAPEKKKAKINRREQILQSLARMLETDSGQRITTANLAKEVGVTEAALYRHFPSKGKMFEGLLEFIEESIFSRVTRIKQESEDSIERLQKIMTLVLAFAEKNPGMCRIMLGDALIGENPVLKDRASQIFARLETEFRQIIRDAEIGENKRLRMPATAGANLLVVNASGRVHQYVRSKFEIEPTNHWAAHWPLLASSLFQ